MKTLRSFKSKAFSMALAVACQVGVCATLSSRVESQDLQAGDFVVGAVGGTGAAAILRISGNQVTTFCQSPGDPFSPDDWGIPPQVMVDSQGHVVFLAALSVNVTRGVGMFRCSSPGGPVEKLAFFSTASGATVPPGYTEAFPGTVFGGFAGLHLSKVRAIVIDDAVNGGKPQVTTEDLYNFAATPSPNPFTDSSNIYRFRTLTSTWEMPSEPGARFPLLPADLINHSGITFSVFHDNVLRRASNPLEFKASGTISQLGLNFSLDLSLFGGSQEVSGLILHDSNIPETDSGCNAGDGISNLMPIDPTVGGFRVMAGLFNVAYDEFGSLGLVTSSDSGAAGTPYLTNISQILLDPSGAPNAVFSQYFHDSFVGCAAVPSLQFSSLVPFFDPLSGLSNLVQNSFGTKAMVSAQGGLVGTQAQAGKVIQIVPHNPARIVASGISSPLGIGTYPNGVQPPAALTLVIRVDSPVNVLTTDPNGSRIGVDATGQVVNDFNVNGFDSGPGEPRFFAIKNAGAGAYSVQGAGTGSGGYTVHIYSANLSQASGQQVVNTGIATPGSSVSFNFNLGADGTLAMAGPSGGDTIPPVTMASLSPQPNGAGWNNRNVTVTLTSTDNEPSGSGVKQITYSGAGAQAIASTTVSGNSATIVISNEGVTTLVFFGTDNAGNVESANAATIRVDKTPPSINCGAPDGLWHAADVSIACTAGDAGSGLANASDASFSLSTSVPAGTETANATTGTHSICDVAGNCAAAGPIVGNMVDKKPPSINVSSPTAGGSNLLNQTFNASYGCVDGGSGVATCSGTVASGAPIDTSSVGSKTFTANATDKVGNVAVPQSLNYSVSYGMCLLYDPTRAVQSGSTIALKIQLCDANNVDVSSSTVVVRGVSLVQVSNSASEVLQASGNANPDNDFRFDSTLGPTGGYIFNLSTKGLTTGTYLLTLTAGADPASHILAFQVR